MLLVPRPEALDLARCGLGKIGDQLDRVRHLVARRPLLDPAAQLGREAEPEDPDADEVGRGAEVLVGMDRGLGV